MIHELRVYYAVPGKLPAVVNRFETITLKIWERFGIKRVFLDDLLQRFNCFVSLPGSYGDFRLKPKQFEFISWIQLRPTNPHPGEERSRFIPRAAAN